MGNESRCRVRFGKQESEGTALLETNEIIFRGDFRLKIPLATIQSVKVVHGELHLRSADGLAIFELGEASAEKWREKILHPKSRIEKLGIKPGARVGLIGFGKADEGFLGEIEKRTKSVTKVTREDFTQDTEWLFLQVETSKQLAQLSKVAKRLRGGAGLWVIYPKGIPKGQQKITEGDVLSAGRAAGLKDVKVVAFSATHTALKFVIPVSQR